MALSTTLITVGVGVTICLVFFIIDEVRRRHTNGDKALNWIMHPKGNETEAYPYEHEILFTLIFKAFPNIKIRGKTFFAKFGWLIFVFVFIPWLFAFVASIAEGTLTIPGNEYGLLEDWWQICVFFTAAVTAFLYRRVIEYVPQAFMSLIEANDKKPESIKKVEKQLQETANYLMQTPESRGNKALIIDLSFFVLMAAVVFIMMWADYHIPLPYISYWGIESFWGHLIYVLYWTILICYLGRLWLGYIFRLILSMRYIATKLSEDGVLQLQPMHPDGAAGLGEFGKLALRTDVQALPISIILFIYFMMFKDINGIFIVAGLFTIMCSPCFFFIPLLGLRKAMNKVKRAELERLSEKFQKHYGTVIDSISEKKKVSDDAVQHAQKEIKRIFMIYDRIALIPEWPFNRHTLEKFSLSIIPILVTIVVVLIDHFVGY